VREAILGSGFILIRKPLSQAKRIRSALPVSTNLQGGTCGVILQEVH
jgi:hypothetical protein